MQEQSPRPTELVVMSWAGGWGRALRSAVSDPFAQATGMHVRHVTHVGLALPESLSRACDRGEPAPFDVVWSNLVPALRAAQRGHARALDRNRVAHLQQLDPRAALESGDDLHVAPAYVVYYVLTYRRDAFRRGAPAHWDVLLDPAFRGRIALYPGGNGLYPIAQTLGGGALEDIPRDMSACWQLMERLVPQVGDVDYSISMGQRIRDEKLDLCFRALTNALAFRDEGLDVGWCAPEPGITETLDCLWIPSTVRESAAAWAERYIDFALSRETQERWCAALGAMPLHRDARPPDLLRSCRLPQHPQDRTGVLYLSERVKLEHEPSWAARFEALLLGEHRTQGVAGGRQSNGLE